MVSPTAVPCSLKLQTGNPILGLAEARYCTHGGRSSYHAGLTHPLSYAGAAAIGETRATLASPHLSPDPVKLATGLIDLLETCSAREHHDVFTMALRDSIFPCSRKLRSIHLADLEAL